MPAIASLEDLKVAQRPNLETKIVAANTLLHADKPQFQLILPMVGQIREELEHIRHGERNGVESLFLTLQSGRGKWGQIFILDFD